MRPFRKKHTNNNCSLQVSAKHISDLKRYAGATILVDNLLGYAACDASLPPDNFWTLPALDTEEQKDLLAEYHNIISKIGEKNGIRSLWWYTWSSSRDRINSGILSSMELVYTFKKALNQGLPDQGVIQCNDPCIARILINLARSNGVQVKVSFRDYCYWIYRKRRVELSSILNSIKVCMRIALLKINGPGKELYIESIKSKPNRTVLVTWVTPDNLTDTGLPVDTYFGHLPKYLENDGNAVVVFGDVSLGSKIKRGHSNYSTFSQVITPSQCISGVKILLALIRGMISPIRGG